MTRSSGPAPASASPLDEPEVVAPGAPGGLGHQGAPDRHDDGEADRGDREEPAGGRGVPGPPAGGHPADGDGDPLQGQDVGVRRQADRGVDERAARDVDGGDDGGEGEEEAGVGEERPDVDRSPPRPGADEHERGEQAPAYQDREERDRAATRPPILLASRDPAPGPGASPGWPEGDAVPLLDGADEEHLARRGGRETGAETASWRASHGATTTRKRAKAGDGRPEGDGRTAGAAAPPGAPAIPGEGEPQRGTHQHAVVAGQGGKALPGARPGQRNGRARGVPGTPSKRARDQGLVEAEVSGWAMRRRSPRGNATRTPAPTATLRFEPASRASAQVSGAASAPARRTAGRRRSRRPQEPDEGHLDQGRQGHPWALEANRQDRVGGIVPPTSAKDPDQVHENP